MDYYLYSNLSYSSAYGRADHSPPGTLNSRASTGAQRHLGSNSDPLVPVTTETSGPAGCACVPNNRPFVAGCTLQHDGQSVTQPPCNNPLPQRATLRVRAEQREEFLRTGLLHNAAADKHDSAAVSSRKRCPEPGNSPQAQEKC